jgi:hypothetical protein
MIHTLIKQRVVDSYNNYDNDSSNRIESFPLIYKSWFQSTLIAPLKRNTHQIGQLTTVAK